MVISKANNQYYAEMFESAINDYINRDVPVNNTGFVFPEEHLQTILEDAKMCATYLNGQHSKYVGRKTSTENCDLIVDGEHIEVKYVRQQSGSGTYFNTSIVYFQNVFGLDSFSYYLEKYGVLKFLEGYFGEKVYSGISPVSIQESSEFRHKNPAAYAQLKKLEEQARTDYVSYIYNYFVQNPESLAIFANDMINKTPKGDNMMADKIIVYRYNTDTISVYNKNEIGNKGKDTSIFTLNGKYSLVLPGFRATIAWQNGTGLNNPTIRIFI